MIPTAGVTCFRDKGTAIERRSALVRTIDVNRPLSDLDVVSLCIHDGKLLSVLNVLC